MKHFLLLLLSLTILFSGAQTIPEGVQPPSWSQTNLPNVKPIKLPGFDLKSLQEEDAINDKDKSKPWRFGHDLYVDDNLFEAGQLTELPNGDKIWRMSYTSEGAFSLNFVFDQFKLPVGAKLYVYNDQHTDLLRPFTHYNNNTEEILGTWLVEGSTAWIEYHEPANVTGDVKLVIGSVVHGYRTGHMYQKALNDSGPCNHDVDCDITPPGADPFNINQKKEDVKSANAMIVVNGFGFCSGTLINNTNNDGTPYFLTANHCTGNVAGWAFRFNWRSPNPSCGTFTGSTNGSFDQTVSGSVLRAASSQSDMKLVEITDPTFFTNNSDLVWAGWNRSTTALPDVNFGIHHPSGDIQKACRDDQGATRTTANFNGNPTTQMWRIADWDLGVTEPGSSGSALYNQDGHIIGMLSAGTAACAGTNDNGGFDIYGRFGVAWNFGSNNASRLDFWLDPAGTNPISLNQFPAGEEFDNDAQASLGAGSPSLQCNEDFEPSVTIVNAGVLNLTSAIVEYQLDSEPLTSVNWSGNLATSEQEVVATPSYQNLSPGPHTFLVNVRSPNGGPDENASNNTLVFNFEVAQDYETNTVVLNLNTDDFANETSWEFRDGNDNLIDSGSGYGDFQNIIETINIPLLDECYTFTILDSYGDGICCGFGNGSYSLEDENGTVIISGGDFGASESVTFRAVDALSTDEFSLDGMVRVYPNPTSDMLNIDTQGQIERFTYELFNTLGQKVLDGSSDPSQITKVSMSSLRDGMYFITIRSNGKVLTQKLIKDSNN
jgi:lysyl endopeptidase